ncbi:MAG: Co-chaperone protein DjlA [Legionellaceae bacterium]
MITWFGRFMGIIIGFLLLGMVGIFIGFILGYQLDRYFDSILRKGRWVVQSAFFDTTFKVLGYIAKADGRVSEREIQAARHIMQRLGLNEEQRLKAIKLFNQGKEGQINLLYEINQLKQACQQQRTLLQHFLEIQLQMAFADGYLSVNKQAILQQICTHLGIAPVNPSAFGFQYQQNQSSYSNQKPYSSSSSLEEAYSLLNISKTVTDVEVKKAYRKLMSQNHPDKLVAKGLSESAIKLATEKTQKIKAAYEVVCAARGMR